MACANIGILFLIDAFSGHDNPFFEITSHIAVMSSANLPVILLVPGAFGTAEGFDPIVPHLKEAGLSTHPGPYPSNNPSDPTTATCAEDIASLRDNVLLPLLENRDVVILAHSYGGAAKNLDKETRSKEGKTGGVVGLIYAAGNITLENESLFDAIGGNYPPFIKVDKPSKGLSLIEPATEVLYNDCDPALAAKLEKEMTPHACLAFETKATAPAWADKAFDGKRAYIRTVDDSCNPTFVQNLWLEKSKVKWDVVDFKTGHMPFVSQPEKLAAQIAKLVNGFLGI
ncbi:alpha/beta-hydrolase [Hypoxylon trugodes]|uniref:alpha/beta-hydrolase n=1 Tax=Hypoxylon trugodes TaxID=326681 RepID=UPI0021971193|nr:alpha/beta-hydrolase [Hypoxylon trugodes]KAI1392359.1 alpha/beta-hydrolase [Hypoxylon trugodes]